MFSLIPSFVAPKHSFLGAKAALMVCGLAVHLGACADDTSSQPGDMMSAAGMGGSNTAVEIEDGGALLLPDGAIVYQEFWARPCPTSSALTYESFGSAFFGHYCVHCHSESLSGLDRNGASVGIDFDNLAGIQSNAKAIWGQAGDRNTFMPAGGDRPSLDERRMLGEWLACGAPGVSETTDE